jgi:quinol monooxygenase YgiN
LKKSTVVVLGILEFPPHRLAGVLPHLKVLVEATRGSAGCIAYDVAEDPFEPGLIRFSELWSDRVSVDRHLLAAHIEPWRAAAREFGLLRREFTAFDVLDSYDV